MKKIIRGGTVVTASDTYQADVLIDQEKVIAIGESLDAEGAEIIDAAHCYLFPGGIDPHTHLSMPFGGTMTSDDFTTGTIAAAFGGTTSILDFCLSSKGQTLQEAIGIWHEKSRGKAVIDYGFHLMIAEANDAILEELGSVVEHEGITSLKVFMAYKNVLQADDETLFKTLIRAKEIGALVQVHAENGDVIDYLTQKAIAAGHTEPIYHALTRPPEAEGEATGRAIALTALADAQLYVVHVSCAQAVQRIAEAREKGWNIYGETCPQYLVLDIHELERPDFAGAKYVWSPPLREAWHQETLWSALGSGILQTIGSDHCPFNFVGQKELGRDDFRKIPNGGPIIEDRFGILFSEGVHAGRISLNQFVDVTSTKAAKLFGLFPKKGTIAIGSDADIVIFDPKATRVVSANTHHMNVDYNPFEGIKLQGDVVSVLSRGNFVIRERQYVGSTGAGQYLHRKRFAKP
ncbi:dihydropyrimidinase [Brevibacillus fluminis]|uniref:Dihydropyrimidinase n=1 Tax=Brevibacillus fluminis TaxID=511487 RepID=A0A3M8DW02_9BACL|nr:dihydropyrimidinase [Brevibacillus fluminis]RNB91675.1 dihydropyrimidinase [Brevibacillus fluminis]